MATWPQAGHGSSRKRAGPEEPSKGDGAALCGLRPEPAPGSLSVQEWTGDNPRTSLRWFLPIPSSSMIQKSTLSPHRKEEAVSCQRGISSKWRLKIDIRFSFRKQTNKHCISFTPDLED